jgi:hypothetical protein
MKESTLGVVVDCSKQGLPQRQFLLKKEATNSQPNNVDVSNCPVSCLHVDSKVTPIIPP